MSFLFYIPYSQKLLHLIFYLRAVHLRLYTEEFEYLFYSKGHPAVTRASWWHGSGGAASSRRNAEIGSTPHWPSWRDWCRRLARSRAALSSKKPRYCSSPSTISRCFMPKVIFDITSILKWYTQNAMLSSRSPLQNPSGQVPLHLIFFLIYFIRKTAPVVR